MWLSRFFYFYLVVLQISCGFNLTKEDIPTTPTVTHTVYQKSTLRYENQFKIQIQFSEEVEVSGSPTIPIKVESHSGTWVQATYKSGTGSSTLIFEYVIQKEDEDLNGIEVGQHISTENGQILSQKDNNLTANLALTETQSETLITKSYLTMTVNKLSIIMNETGDIIILDNLEITQQSIVILLSKLTILMITLWSQPVDIIPVGSLQITNSNAGERISIPKLEMEQVPTSPIPL